MATADRSSAAAFTTHIQQTKFWNTLLDDVFGPRKGGAIIIIDAENARKGVAKTSAAVALSRLLARAFRYELCRDDFFLAGPKYVERYREHPGKHQPSVMTADELVGAGAADPGRWNSEDNRKIRQAAQILRAKRVVTIFTLPDWNDADPNLQKLADYRLWCREKPIGMFQPYKITTPFNSQSSQVKTKGLSRVSDGARRIHFPNMPAYEDPYYAHLAALKDELIDSQSWDASTEDGEQDEIDVEEAKRRQAIRYAVRAYQPWNESANRTYKDVAKVVDYSAAWVSDRVNEWRDGEHRDIVAKPERAKHETIA